MKGQALDDLFKFNESEKDKNDYFGNLGKWVYQISVNCHIHLGKNEREINQGLNVRVGNLSECCVQCIMGKRRQTRLPMDKGFELVRVSLYICNDTGSTSLY